MDAQATAVFLRFFKDLKDPRRPNVRHLFTDILTIAIIAVMCRADDWSEVVTYGQSRLEWFKTFLELPNGIPSVDTFRRVFWRINPEAFERCFAQWTRELAQIIEEVIAVDGKTSRRSFDKTADMQAIHLVSAWSAQNQLVLGQLATEAKSNEITAIPKLLDLLNLKKAIVTIDAMGCQTGIAEKILHGGGDYILAVKDNQPTLHAQTQALLDEAILEGFKAMNYDYFEQTEKGHGRLETRRCWVTNEIQWIGDGWRWPGLQSLVVIESHRTIKGQTTVERRYYISSLPGDNAQKMAQAIRAHWGVENQLHWRLDMSFREDESRLHKGHGAENFSRLRRIAMNKLKGDPSNSSLKNKRYRCSIDPNYLLERLKQ